MRAGIFIYIKMLSTLKQCVQHDNTDTIISPNQLAASFQASYLKLNLVMQVLP